MTTRSFVSRLLPLLAMLAGCSGTSLNGGSNAGKDGTPASAGSIPDGPLQGSVSGHPFTMKAAQVGFDTAHAQWFLTIFNYEESCGIISGAPPSGADALIVTIGNVPNKTGDTTIAYADGHGATFQVGLGATTSSAQANPVTAGVLHMDTWSETPGDKVSGGLHLVDADSDIGGTFTATVCAAR